MENYHFYQLSNNMRGVHQHATSSPIAHFGITIKSGSREEKENEQGLAHFIEHTIFKGTTKRKPFHILSRLDVVGGELNAYTTKEETCIYASFLSDYYERAMELISDILFNSVFPEHEIEKEKDVVIDEINSYLDSPSEQIFDDFEDLLDGFEHLLFCFEQLLQPLSNFQFIKLRDAEIGFVVRNLRKPPPCGPILVWVPWSAWTIGHYFFLI